MKRAKITEELAYGSALDRLTGAEILEPAPEQPVVSVPPPEPVMIKLSVFLTRDEDAYLEGLASLAKFSGGKKLSKTKLIENMVKAFRRSSLDVSAVKTEDELLRRISAQMRD